MRILLVKPSPRLGTIRGLQSFQFLEPLELGYLAAAAPAGHDTRVADLRRAQFPEHRFRCTLRRFRPDLVGFTGYTHEVSAIRRLARLTRKDGPAARVVVGGHHATVAPADFDGGEIDAVVRGEGCAPFRALVECIARGEEFDGLPHVRIPRTGRGAEELPRDPDPATLPTPRRVRKGGTVAANERALDRLRALGIAVHVAFMLTPESSAEDFARLRAFVASRRDAHGYQNLDQDDPRELWGQA